MFGIPDGISSGTSIVGKTMMIGMPLPVSTFFLHPGFGHPVAMVE